MKISVEKLCSVVFSRYKKESDNLNLKIYGNRIVSQKEIKFLGYKLCIILEEAKTISVVYQLKQIKLVNTFTNFGRPFLGLTNSWDSHMILVLHHLMICHKVFFLWRAEYLIKQNCRYFNGQASAFKIKRMYTHINKNLKIREKL
ncbi:hypothetical protein BpHYR1_002388 [Brachionus plicatilis]|uniref:RNA-directed DNA polymerase from mobile element jockey-like n=1 Tax=Brachionus plicatilis TaxID=10195 RepID=A0A3M7QFP1_BRAPC|nr:hypothetical protein BpHYR1_002388 [Brachionus plicatilis]